MAKLRKNGGNNMRGIDISHHNGWPFNAVTEKGYKESDFVIIKATQGTSYQYADYFAKAVARAYKDGKLIGAYHYAAGGDAIKEADYFLSVVNGFLGSVIIALDWEEGSNKSWGSRTWAKTFIDHIYQKTGVRCFLYTGNDGIKQCANVTAPLWYARYPNRANSWSVPAWKYDLSPWKSYGIWQFTDSEGKLDRNTSAMTKNEWKAYAAPVKAKEATVAVKIGSARIDERGRISGGSAGDQTKNEVGTQNWYLHSKGWHVLRAKDPTLAEKIAVAMERACYNQNIGYDQNQRNTLYNLASKVGFDPGKVTSKCETDCSALVRVCLAYAGIKVGDFNTSTEKAVILGTKKFTQIADAYSKSQDYMKRGDILVTKTKGHTVVVLSNGSKVIIPQKPVEAKKTGYTGAFPTLPPRGYFQFNDGIKTLVVHRAQVKRVQALVNWIANTKLEVDGEYGAHTEQAVKKAQKLLGVKADGKFGEKTLAAAKVYRK